MHKTIVAQTGTAFILKKGQILKVIDPTGEQVADLFCADEKNSEDTFSSGRTMDYNESIHIKPGFFLYSNAGNRMLEMIEDTSPGIHDLLVTPCSLQMFQMVNKNMDYHPSCLGNLASNLQQFKIKQSQITSTFNIFMNIKISEIGHLEIKAPPTKANDYITFKACRDLIVGLTACSDEATNNGACKEIKYHVSSV